MCVITTDGTSIFITGGGTLRYVPAGTAGVIGVGCDIGGVDFYLGRRVIYSPYVLTSLDVLSLITLLEGLSCSYRREVIRLAVLEYLQGEYLC